MTEIDPKAERVRGWAKERGLYDEGDPYTQFLKLQEESGELAQGLLKKRPQEVKDAIGDMYTVLVNLAHLAGFRIEDCIDHSWNEIKYRSGKMENGTFVKSNYVND